jgi:hypothetical protein
MTSGTQTEVKKFSRFVTFKEPGESITGRYLGTRPMTFRDETRLVRVLDVGENDHRFLPHNLDLEQKMAEVSEGTRITVTYVTPVPCKNGRTLKRYRVEPVDEHVQTKPSEDDVPF